MKTCYSKNIAITLKRCLGGVLLSIAFLSGCVSSGTPVLAPPPGLAHDQTSGVTRGHSPLYHHLKQQSYLRNIQ